MAWGVAAGRSMISLENTTPYDLEQSVFDTIETNLLGAAFEKAWAYVEFDPMLGALDAWERQSELARCLMAILKRGETNPTSLANSAIRLLRKSQDALRRGIADEKRAPAAPKKGGKRVEDQTEMLLPISGKKGKEAATKPAAKPTARQKRAS
jgi:hypothetical protein